MSCLRLKLKYRKLLSIFAFNFNTRRYNMVDLAGSERLRDSRAAGAQLKVGRCRLTLSNPRSKVKALGIKLLKLKYEEPVSNFASKFNLRRYIKEAQAINKSLSALGTACRMLPATSSNTR